MLLSICMLKQSVYFRKSPNICHHAAFFKLVVRVHFAYRQRKYYNYYKNLINIMTLIKNGI